MLGVGDGCTMQPRPDISGALTWTETGNWGELVVGSNGPWGRGGVTMGNWPGAWEGGSWWFFLPESSLIDRWFSTSWMATLREVGQSHRSQSEVPLGSPTINCSSATCSTMSSGVWPSGCSQLLNIVERVTDCLKGKFPQSLPVANWLQSHPFQDGCMEQGRSHNFRSEGAKLFKSKKISIFKILSHSVFTNMCEAIVKFRVKMKESGSIPNMKLAI